MSLITVEKLSKSFGTTLALRDISFQVKSGEALLFLGANGAGKSTLLSCLAGITKPDRGRISYHEKCLFGVLLIDSFLYTELTGLENLLLYADLYQLPDPRNQALRCLKQMGLEHHRQKKVCDYTPGMLKRLSFGRTILHNPQVLILDEPFAHLDREGRDIVLSMLMQYRAEKRTLLIAAHDEELIAHDEFRQLHLDQGKVTEETFPQQQNIANRRHR